jgi:hypothetical protein
MNLRKLFSLPFVLGLAIGVLANHAAADMLGSAVFSDVPAGSYFDAAIGRLYGAGIVKGSAGMFHPTDYVTRADVAVMIDRAINGGEMSSSSRSSRSSSVSSSSSSSVSSSSSSSSSSSQQPVGEAGAFKFTAEKVTMPESATNVSISVTRYSGSKGAVTVHYATANGTAVEGEDFNGASGTVSFADGQTTKVISLKLINDEKGEAAETFTVTLSDPTSGAVLGTPIVATITILENDGGAGSTGGAASSSSNSNATVSGNFFTFGAWAYSVDENAGAVTITVLRKGDTGAAATVKYSTVDGSAKAGTDYAATQGTLSFASGETSKTFSVQVSDNSAIEGNRSLTLKLTEATGGPTVGNPGTVGLTIVDNEAISAGSGTVLFSAETYTVREKDGNATINILRRGDLNKTVTVKYATSDSTATSGSDYTGVNNTMTFGPNETSKSFVIPILTDTLTENEEKVNLTLSDPSGIGLGTVPGAVLKISD